MTETLEKKSIIKRLKLGNLVM